MSKEPTCMEEEFGPLDQMPDIPAKSEPLIGYMILEDYCDDMSDWSGVITGPQDPTGANLAWESPIKMIEYSAYQKRDHEAKMFCRLYNEALDKIVKLEKECGRDPGDY